MTTTSIEWARPELLATADAWAAYRTVMAILADRGATPTADAIRAEATAGRCGRSPSPTTSATAGRPRTPA